MIRLDFLAILLCLSAQLVVGNGLSFDCKFQDCQTYMRRQNQSHSSFELHPHFEERFQFPNSNSQSMKNFKISTKNKFFNHNNEASRPCNGYENLIQELERFGFILAIFGLLFTILTVFSSLLSQFEGVLSEESRFQYESINKIYSSISNSFGVEPSSVLKSAVQILDAGVGLPLEAPFNFMIKNIDLAGIFLSGVGLILAGVTTFPNELNEGVKKLTGWEIERHFESYGC